MATGKRVRIIGRLEYQSWTDKASGEQGMRAAIVASQVLFLDHDRAHIGLVQEPAILEVVQPEAETRVKPKRSRHKLIA